MLALFMVLSIRCNLSIFLVFVFTFTSRQNFLVIKEVIASILTVDFDCVPFDKRSSYICKAIFFSIIFFSPATKIGILRKQHKNGA